MINKTQLPAGSKKSPKLVMTVTANFTAEPVGDTLRFWMDRLQLQRVRLDFSGYNQVFQELMAPESLLASGEPGMNFLLIRLEDWARELKPGNRVEAISNATREFIEALKTFAKRARRPNVLFLAGPSREAVADAALRAELQSLDGEIRKAVRSLRGIHLIGAEELAALYPVEIVEDPESDRQAHIPFTTAYWTAIGTMLARKARTLMQPPYKVIVVDADNTLWGGVVGEIGASQVQINGEYLELQRFLRKQKNNGLLLALASKNEEADVAEAFKRGEMVLRREDFVAWKINWEPKSRNIAALAKELELGLDSFIFLDDNPVECAEVQDNCPGVITLLLPPASSKRMQAFLEHAWVFDGTGATAVDEKRTELYREQGERNRFRTAATSFREFIDGLNLQVSIEPPTPADYDRAAQLTQRTNQFNSTGIRRVANELGALLESGERRMLLVSARDRFGDYGQVGLAVLMTEGKRLIVENILMSCRVLGKGVEHRVLAAIGREAERVGAEKVVFPYLRTDRNQPAEKFFRSVGMKHFSDGSFQMSTQEAAGVQFHPESGAAVEIGEESEEVRPVKSSTVDFLDIAMKLDSVQGIMAAVANHLRRVRPQLANELVLPRNSTEALIAKIWEDVLHIDHVGVTDSFLSLGGQSLQAVSISSRMAAEFGVQVPLIAVLSHPTIVELAELVGRARKSGAVGSLPKAEELTLSAAQQRLWFLDQFIPNRAAYNIPVARRIRGPFDFDALKKALAAVTLRHATLRSSFSAHEGAAAIKQSNAPSFFAQQVRASSENEAIRLANQETSRAFNLSDEPLLRAVAISLSQDDHILVFNVHHIVSDGWSMGILLRDLSEAYGSAIAGRQPSWRSLPATYADYAEWQRTRLAAGDFESDLEYWKNELRGAPALLEIPSDKPRPSVMTYVGGSVRTQVAAATRRAMEKLAERENCTPFAVLLAVFQTLLHRYSQAEDIVVGVPVAGRTHSAVEELVGCFVNTLAIRSGIDGGISFREQLQKTRGKILDALAHQDLPFDYLVNELGLARDLSHSPVFQAMLVLQSNIDKSLVVGGSKVSSMAVHNGGAKFDLVLEVTPEGAEYALGLEYNSTLFEAETVQRVLGHFVHLLEEACAAPETSLALLPVMDREESQRMLTFVNGPETIFENVECLHRSFERRVQDTPDAAALSFETQRLSYRELNRRANQLAHQLIACGVGPDVLVGICFDRSVNLLVAILGVLKSGGAYLPIDLSYPAERLSFMLKDANAPILLTETKFVAALPKDIARTICLDDTSTLEGQPENNPSTEVTPEHMAYVIYTSGSTGNPKGCTITHRNVARLMLATEKSYGFNERDVWTMFHSPAFDFSVWEIWGALLYGGRLVVVPFLVSRSPEAFYELIATEQVTVLNQTPSAFRQLIQAEESVGQKALALRYVIFGGEALDMQTLRPWFERHGDQQPRLVNMYGITETTVHVSYRPLSKDDLNSGSVIGKPISDLQIYVLDAHRQPVPLGIPGEMYVGGGGLARGYLNRKELTAERFISDHLTGRKGSRLYKTGDAARLLAGRDIEYLGRIDQQVKIRGFRIELGEIESTLSKHPAVREVAVMAREDVPGTKRLVGYLVTSTPAPEISALRDYLKQTLPEYMVPSVFVFLEKMPLTVNGKIDRKALPAPEQQRPELVDLYVAPRTEAEKKLVTIWSKALRVEQVGINDNFFELGGDSILSIQIISAARRVGLKLTPKLLFANQTIATLATAAGVTETEAVANEAVGGELPLTPIENWFFEQQLADAHHYNQSFIFEVTERWGRSTLGAAVVAVGEHHDALRLRFTGDGRDWRQRYSADVTTETLVWVDLANAAETALRAEIEAIAAQQQSTLNIEKGPLWRVVYFDLGSERPGRLLVVVHHLAVDGISWRPLLEDLETAYQQLHAGKQVELPAKTAAYKVWAERLQQFAKSETLLKELPYWKAETEPAGVAGALKPLTLSAQAAAANTEERAKKLKVSLDADVTQALLQTVPAAYNTQINDVLLTALARAWSLWSGNAVLYTNLEGHGREHLFDDVDISRTVGWFTSIFPVRLELRESEKNWQPGHDLKSVKEQLRRIPRRGVGYGILRYLNAESGLAHRAEPGMVFNYLGQFDQAVVGLKLFRFAAESTGPWHSPKQKRRHALEINGAVLGGRLEFEYTYNPALHDEKNMQRFADEFVKALKEIVAHCQLPEAGGRTPSDFPLARVDQNSLDQLLAGQSDVEDVYGLSPIQTLFFSANQAAAQPGFDQWQCTLRGPLDVAAFERAWNETVRRHTILRSTIVSDGLREPLQVVHRQVRLPWAEEDWRETPEQEQTGRWNALLKEDRAQPLALAEAPPMRFRLIRLADETWKFLWSVPALLLDGWSWPLVFRDASRLYEAYTRNVAAQLEPARPYRDYLEWLNEQATGDATKFWQEQLAGLRKPTALPSGTVEHEGGSERYMHHVVQLSSDATNALQTSARRLQVTLSTLVQGAWSLLLSRQSGEREVVFGAAFSGRPTDLPGVESIVGPFTNNLPVRVAVEAEETAGEFFRKLHSKLLQLSTYQFTPLMEIQRVSEVPWRYRLFDSLVVFQNYLVDESARRLGSQVEIADFEGPVHTNYPVLLLAEPGVGLRLTLIYDRKTVARSTVERWGRDLGILLELTPVFFNKRVGELQGLLSPQAAQVTKKDDVQAAQTQNFVPAQTEMEHAIAAVWQKMFGLEQVNVEANFFDLGGHSLLLVQMHSLLREKLKSEFPIVALFEHPTVRALARHLGKPTESSAEKGEELRSRAERQKRALAQMRGPVKK